MASGPKNELPEPTPDRVEAGSPRSRWISSAAFVRLVNGAQADVGLRGDLKSLAPDTTDDS